MGFNSSEIQTLYPPGKPMEVEADEEEDPLTSAMGLLTDATDLLEKIHRSAKRGRKVSDKLQEEIEELLGDIVGFIGEVE